mmetsp:Transcript_102672/g.257375  ORF Transcript_102672/g.257375 Transcript_102672/m.257375 type:complete len:221 (+) Transcript_102672:2221-2883(+)
MHIVWHRQPPAEVVVLCAPWDLRSLHKATSICKDPQLTLVEHTVTVGIKLPEEGSGDAVASPVALLTMLTCNQHLAQLVGLKKPICVHNALEGFKVCPLVFTEVVARCQAGVVLRPDRLVSFSADQAGIAPEIRFIEPPSVLHIQVLEKRNNKGLTVGNGADIPLLDGDLPPSSLQWCHHVNSILLLAVITHQAQHSRAKVVELHALLDEALDHNLRPRG